MTLADLLLHAAGELERNRIPFYLVGGLAMAAWVAPRGTEDVDLVVCIGRHDSPRLRTALIGTGARPTQTDLRKLLEKRFVRFRVGRASLDLRMASTPHDHEAAGRSRVVEIAGRRLRVAAPEDLLLYKLAAWRPHDRSDAYALLTQREDLDRTYVQRWLDPIAEESGAPMRDRWRDLLAMK